MVRVTASHAAPDLGDRGYGKDIDRLVASTAMQHGDLDDKALKLLDHLELHGGRAGEAIRSLEESLHGRKRSDVDNWHAYVYTLLRGFDAEAYRDMKAAEGKRSRRGQRSGGSEPPRAPAPAARAFALNPAAAEFVPGRCWSRATTPEEAPQPSPRPAAAVQTPERTPEATEEAERLEIQPGICPEPEMLKPEVAPKGALSKAAEGVPSARAVGWHAVGGAVALGAGLGVGGLAAGGALGAAGGLLTAPLTFGLSIPVGVVLGGGAGLCAGAAAGSTSGLFAGGLLGYWRALRTTAAA